jgi:hypothetical protein
MVGKRREPGQRGQPVVLQVAAAGEHLAKGGRRVDTVAKPT